MFHDVDFKGLTVTPRPFNLKSYKSNQLPPQSLEYYIFDNLIDVNSQRLTLTPGLVHCKIPRR